MSAEELNLGNIESVSAGTREYAFRQHGPFFLLVTFLSAGASALVLLFLRNNSSHSSNELLVIIAPLFIPFGLYGYYAQKVQHLFMRQLAGAIGFAYSDTAPLESVHGTFFTLGHSQAISDCLSGIYKGRPVRIFTYRFTEGTGKNRYTYTQTIFEIQSPVPLPHVILNLPDWFAHIGMEEVELEGDFNQSFSVCVEKGKQMEVREVLQPDVMATLVDSFAPYCIELSGTDLYLVKKGIITKKQSFMDTVAVVDTLCDKIIPEFAAMAAGVGVVPPTADAASSLNT